MYNPVLKGGFEYDLTGTVLTVASKGRTIVEFPKVAGGGKVTRLDLSGSKGIFTIDLAAYPVNMYCGISDAAWANAMPWYDFLVNVDNTAANVKLGVTRNPTLTVLPAHASINFSDGLASGGQAQTNVILNCAHDAALGAMPVASIGSHRQTYTAGATDLWAVGAFGFTDGFGKFQEGVRFTLPVGQNGCADSTEVFDENGAATNLHFDPTSLVEYTIDRKGWQHVSHYHTTQAVAGVGANIVRWYLPYSAAGSGLYIGKGYSRIGTVGLVVVTIAVAGFSYVTSYGSTATSAPVNANSFSDTADYFYFDISVPAF